LEDPVECVLPGVNQVQINPKGGLDFASGLRSVLRQDPDIIMVGEIRDKPTAELAVQAALTGHLVLSTLHTRRAAGAVMRLIDMGIEPLLLMSSLIGVIAQRLVRKVCPECRTEAALAAGTKIRLGLPAQEVQFMRGTGCSWCNYSGYWGRMAIQEILAVNSEMQSLIEAGSSELALARAAEAQGMKTLWQDGLEKAAQGETTIEEILRAVDQD
jgi:type IV pilus assembly protein PilB